MWGCGAGLREQAFWLLLHDSGAAAGAVLALDAGAIDLRGRRARAAAAGVSPTAIRWDERAGDLLGWLLAGRTLGPVFLTDRRAPAGARPRDICPLDGRCRMSYRRSAEIFTGHTRRIDPAGRGWTLHQLRHAASDAR